MRILRVVVYDNPTATCPSERTTVYDGADVAEIPSHSPTSISIRLKTGRSVTYYGVPYRIDRDDRDEPF